MEIKKDLSESKRLNRFVLSIWEAPQSSTSQIKMAAVARIADIFIHYKHR